MKKINLTKYEQDWDFFHTAIGTVDGVKVLGLEYRCMEVKTIVWGLYIFSLDAIYMSEQLYNWDKYIYRQFIIDLIKTANEVFKDDKVI